jgi:D-arabinose 1-dehydrogenase-like Zn-dependent alcohol dehydrogenase
MNTTYKAIQVTAPGRLELVQRPIPEPGPGQARIRVEACGVCHTDAATVEGAFPGLVLPRVPGHEVIGRIEALGSGVAGWTIGQRVGVGFLGGYCTVCEACNRGDFTHCRQQPFLGVHVDGGYAEVMIAQVHGLVRIPEDLTSVEAAPLLCAGVTTFKALRNSKARAGDLVAIQGVGGLGHLAIQFARQMGFRVAAIARGPGKEALARTLGADRFIDSTAEEPGAALQALGGARLIVATAANSSSMSPLIRGLAPHGEMVVAGVGGDEPIALSPVEMLFGERTVSGTLTGSPADSEDTLAFSVLRGIRARIETVPLAEAARAYRRMMDNEARFRMVLTMGQ